MTGLDLTSLHFTSLHFTAGDLSDLGAASGVLTASALALEARGEGLWPPASLSVEKLARFYPPDTWRVAWKGEVAVACYTLLGSDPLFWPDDPPGSALYLHKLAVHPEWQGRNLAHTMLERAQQETAQRGVPWLRLDTATHRPKLRALYERFGFQRVAEREVKGFEVTLYQLAVRSGQAASTLPDAR